jgi:hypothetical protein
VQSIDDGKQVQVSVVLILSSRLAETCTRDLFLDEEKHARGRVVKTVYARKDTSMCFCRSTWWPLRCRPFWSI